MKELISEQLKLKYKIGAYSSHSTADIYPTPLRVSYVKLLDNTLELTESVNFWLMRLI